MANDEQNTGGVAEYPFREIEAKWQTYWLKNKTFKTPETSTKPKCYILDMFPYPSGDGLHVGHPEGYTASDIVARYKRHRGFNVLHPMGWDAFGLPAEQHAIKTGQHPRDTTVRNIARFKAQIQSIGLSYDWDREIDTSSVEYYRWTQWVFLRLYERGLAYESYQPVNWCPVLGTVLANEEVVDGVSEVGGHPVERRQMRQWVLKITAYAERLLEDLALVDWPESVKEMQRNWIGKSLGADIVFDAGQEAGSSANRQFTVFSTRPDTIFGATFCVLAPEHPLVEAVTTADEKSAVGRYVEEAKNRSDLDRTAAKKKSGVFTGAYAVNPVNDKPLPIFVADYVLMTYGHGAIMGVPAHDERDHDFARQYGLKIVRVISGGEGDIEKEPYLGDGLLVNSGFLDGMRKDDAMTAVGAWLEKKGRGRSTVTYKLRDWLFSRQRYWGEPFPLARGKDGTIVAFQNEDLPITLPALDEFRPTGDGEPPLTRAKEWLTVTKDGQTLTRETNVMPQWAGSCWYYLRFVDPHNENAPWDKAKESYWLPVDLYVGGVEHAVLHLLYARFWHKVLYDCGLVSTKEPFQKLVNQGMILGENGEKMSKSRGNVVNPDDVITSWGADSLRLYEMFLGPLEAAKPWQTNGIAGVHRFLKRAWRLFIADDGKLTAAVASGAPSVPFQRLMHRTIKKVTEDIDGMRFNTAISALMEFVNGAYKEPTVGRDIAEVFVKLLNPFAPHIAEELWSRLGKSAVLTYESWPLFDPSLCVENTVTVSVQINGKLRATVTVPLDMAGAELVSVAKMEPSVARHLEGRTIVKEIIVPQKIINFVVR